MAAISQKPGQLDIIIVPGDDLTATIYSSKDLSGCDLTAFSGLVEFAVAETPESTNPGHYYNITIAKEQSALFVEGQEWRLRYTDAGLKRRTVGAGRIRTLEWAK